MIRELHSEQEREVDVLIEATLAGHELRMAVECRSRGRIESVQWIDELIGKYQFMNIDKVVAVSTSGFSKAACEKAAKNGIDTLTLEEAESIDWARNMIRPGLAIVSNTQFRLVRVDIVSEEPVARMTSEHKAWRVLAGGKPISCVDDFIQEVLDTGLVRAVKSYVEANMLSLYPTLAALAEERMFTIEGDFPEHEFEGSNGCRLNSSQLLFFVICHWSVEKLDVLHRQLGNHSVSTAKHADTSKVVEFKIVQTQGSASLHARVDIAEK